MADGKPTILMLATFAMEIVECGGALVKNARAGGRSHAAVALCRPENRQDAARAAEVLETSVEFLDFEYGHLAPEAGPKKKLVGVIRRVRPDICVMQDPEHSFHDLDPDRRLAMILYLEALALASRDFALEDLPGLEPCPIPTVYYMTPERPNCVVNVADVWEVKERAMNCLRGQQQFTASVLRQRLPAAALESLVGSELARAGDLELGRALHSVLDRSFHVYHGLLSHSRYALAEPYRRQGSFELERLVG